MSSSSSAFEMVNEKFFRTHPVPIVTGGLNVLLFLWSLKLILFDPTYQPSLLRWIVSIVFPALLAAHGYRRQSVSLSGMISGVLVAFSMLMSNYTVFIALLVCFFTTTRATRYRDDIKSRFEANFKKGGQRDWIQIVCNLGVANLLVLVQLIAYGIGESEMDFHARYWESWLLVGALGAISCALGDTLSSELGPVMAEDADPLLITSLRPVPKGTNGGITIAGLIAACAGGLIIGLGSWLAQVTVPGSSTIEHHSPQWPIIFFCTYAGLFGSLVDSLLGATCQYTGYDHLRKRIVETPPGLDNPGTYVEHISGVHLLDNHSVNLLSIAAMALVTPYMAGHFWPIESSVNLF